MTLSLSCAREAGVDCRVVTSGVCQGLALHVLCVYMCEYECVCARVRVRVHVYAHVCVSVCVRMRACVTRRPACGLN
jgi:hypothetical protein